MPPQWFHTRVAGYVFNYVTSIQLYNFSKVLKELCILARTEVSLCLNPKRAPVMCWGSDDYIDYST